MGANSSIEWTDHTFNAWIGCAKVSPGCKFCYAEADFDRRKGRAIWGPQGTRSVTGHANWAQVLRWQSEAERDGVRRRVFVNSLSDVFELFGGQLLNHKGDPMWWAAEDRSDLDLPMFRPNMNDSMQFFELYEPLTLGIVRKELFRLIDRCQNLDFLLLTKRPQNIINLWPREQPYTLGGEKKGRAGDLRYLSNVWVGFSAEDQDCYDSRIKHMVPVKRLVPYLFCSMEPQLGPIDPYLDHPDYGPLVDCYIVGGESGHSRREWNPDWGRLVRDACAKAGVAFFGKQWDKVRPLPEDLLIRQLPGQ